MVCCDGLDDERFVFSFMDDVVVVGANVVLVVQRWFYSRMAIYALDRAAFY